MWNSLSKITGPETGFLRQVHREVVKAKWLFKERSDAKQQMSFDLALY